MTYVKPSDVTYTQMAIWIDANAYQPNFDETQLYEYLYHLVVMLAGQAGYFHTQEELDSFGLFAASRLFLRLQNSKQFETTDEGIPRMKQIKSILNYIKTVLYPYKVDYELEFNIENKNIDIIPTGTFDFGSHLIDQTSLFDSVSFACTMDSVSTICRAYLKRIPYKQNSAEWTNIYISCMLSLIDSVTLTNQKLKQFSNGKVPKQEVLDKLYSELRYQPPILFHLDKSMGNYIATLVNELRHVIAAELSWKESSYISSDATMKSLICTAFDKEADG